MRYRLSNQLNLIRVLAEWQRRVADRCRLGRLDAHALADIGLNCTIAAEETRRPFWRAVELTPVVSDQAPRPTDADRS